MTVKLQKTGNNSHPNADVYQFTKTLEVNHKTVTHRNPFSSKVTNIVHMHPRIRLHTHYTHTHTANLAGKIKILPLKPILNHFGWAGDT